MYRLLVWEINVGHSFVCWSSLSLETSPFPHLSSGTCQTGKRYVINRFNFVSFCKTQKWYKWSMCFNFLLLFSRKMAIFVPKAVHMISLLLALWILIGHLLPTGFKILIKPVSWRWLIKFPFLQNCARCGYCSISYSVIVKLETMEDDIRWRKVLANYRL